MKKKRPIFTSVRTLYTRGIMCCALQFLTVFCAHIAAQSGSDTTYTAESEVFDGWLAIGIEEKTVTDSLGEPEKGEDEYWEALGMYVQRWHYSRRGVTLDMGSENQGEKKRLISFTVTAPSTYKPSRHIGIGDTEKDIIRKHRGFIDADASVPGRTVVIGSIYEAWLLR